MRRALLASIGILAALPFFGTAAAAHAAEIHTVTLSNVRIEVDDDDFFKWQSGVFTPQLPAKTVSAGSLPVSWDVSKCVDEVRVDIHLVALVVSAGTAQVQAELRLFEGDHCGAIDSDGADDLDGNAEAFVNATAGGAARHLHGYVDNTDELLDNSHAFLDLDVEVS